MSGQVSGGAGGAGKHLRRALLALLLLTAAGSVVWYRHLGGDAPEQPLPLPDNDARAQMVTRNFRHVETKMDRTIWVLEARKAEIFEESARLHTVKITWYGEEEGQLPVIITSKAGRMNFKSRNAALLGSVRIARADGTMLKTEQLFWTDARKMLRAPGRVLIKSEGVAVRGDRMEADVRQKWVKLSGQVRGEIQPGSRLLTGHAEEGHGKPG